MVFVRIGHGCHRIRVGLCHSGASERGWLAGPGYLLLVSLCAQRGLHDYPLLCMEEGVRCVWDKGGQRGGKGERNLQRTT